MLFSDDLKRSIRLFWTGFLRIFLWSFTACSSFAACHGPRPKPRAEVLLNLVTAIVCNEAFETSRADEADLAKQWLGRGQRWIYIYIYLL